MREENKQDALKRLATVRGHLDGVIRMVQQEAYCVDLMKQLSALQASLEKVSRVVFRNHLETCFTEAVSEGRGPEAIAELVECVKFSPTFTGPNARLAAWTAGERVADETKN